MFEASPDALHIDLNGIGFWWFNSKVAALYGSHNFAVCIILSL